MSEESGLSGSGGQRVALKSVHVEARLEGLLLRVRAKQSYRNETSRNIEAVYTFPLAWGATLLGLAAEIGGKRLQATVVERNQAEEDYEAAIVSGDTPVMVERSAAGLHTANLGNLRAGEEAVIELEYAQLLRFEQGRIRLVIPTVIAARYGDAHSQGGLAAHETDSADPTAQYPFTLALDLVGAVSRAQISCPSHTVGSRATPEGMRIDLVRGAWLDRDFILELNGIEGASFALTAPDGERHVGLASFCPALAREPDSPIRLKILVDCSGSMEGDSIEAARRALHTVLQELDERDSVSFSRFGGRVAHYLKRMASCSTATIAYVSDQVSSMSASLGGTEMRQALVSTIESIRPPSAGEEGGAACVLLITDGAVWAAEDIIRAAAGADHRIFAVGVGSAPAESLLRELAERTGGACELVSPNEDVDAAIVRMFRRMRGGSVAKVHVDWGAEPRWQSPLPRRIFSDETLHVFARFDAAPTRPPVLSFVCNGARAEARPPELTTSDDAMLGRLCAAKRIAVASNAEQALALKLALEHHLVTDQTNLLLVHVCAEEDKANGLPALSQLAQMMAAGHGGFGSTTARTLRTVFSPSRDATVPGCVSFADFDDLDMPAIWRSPSATTNSQMAVPEETGFDRLDIPAFLRKEAEKSEQGGRDSDSRRTALRPLQLLLSLENGAAGASSLRDVLRRVETDVVDTPAAELVGSVVREFRDLGESDLIVWAVFIKLLAARLVTDHRLSRHLRRLLLVEISSAKTVDCDSLRQALEQRLRDIGPNCWSLSLGNAPATLT